MKEERKGKPKRAKQEENSYNLNRGSDPEKSNKNIYIRGNTPNQTKTYTSEETRPNTLKQCNHTHSHTDRNAYTHSRAYCAKQLGFL